MKKIIKSFLVVLMGFLMSVNVMADVQQEKQNPDYTTDYYMIVESKAGGIDIYSLPDLSSSKLNDSQIPNGTALHIEGETEDKENIDQDGKNWGATKVGESYIEPSGTAAKIAEKVNYNGVSMKIYIWMEGTDSDCVNMTGLEEGMKNPTFDVTVSLVGVAVK